MKELHEDAMRKTLALDDGTYDMITLEPVSFSDGYQVTFCQVGDNYDDATYRYLVGLFCELSSDCKVYIGKFCGEPEISFHFDSKYFAKYYAKMFNQVSVWNWKKSR